MRKGYNSKSKSTSKTPKKKRTPSRGKVMIAKSKSNGSKKRA